MKYLTSRQIRTRLSIAVALLWCATLAGFAGGWWWPMDLLSSFHPHYAAAFLAGALLMLATRRWLLVAAALGGFVLNASVLAGPFSAAQASHRELAANARPLRVVTLNVWFRNHDYDRVARYLEATQADVVILQEVDAAQALEIGARLDEYPYRFVEAARVRHGAAILSRHPLGATQAVRLTPEGVTVARARLEVRGQPVTVIGAHLHWPVGPRDSRLRNDELAALGRLAADVEGPLVIAGDLNITPFSPWFAKFLDESGLADCSGGAALPGSWPAWFGPAAIRIDHCLMSTHFAPLATRRGARVGSDHAPLVNDLALAVRLARH